MAVGHQRYMWDPVLIVSQIIAVQATFYVSWAFLLAIVWFLSRRPLHLSLMLDANSLNLSLSGCVNLMILVLNSISSSLAVWGIVQRAKLISHVLFISFTFVVAGVIRRFLSVGPGGWQMGFASLSQLCQFTIMAMGHFRRYMWDPVLIVSQIIAVQATFYVSWAFLLAIVWLLYRRPLHLSLMFDANSFNLSVSGRVNLMILVLNSISSSLAVWGIVQRAKLCLDFTCTLHFIHFCCCWCYSSFPGSWTWWLANGICISLTALSSEYLCMRYEMKAIPITTSGVHP